MTPRPACLLMAITTTRGTRTCRRPRTCVARPAPTPRPAAQKGGGGAAGERRVRSQARLVSNRYGSAGRSAEQRLRYRFRFCAIGVTSANHTPPRTIRGERNSMMGGAFVEKSTCAHARREPVYQSWRERRHLRHRHKNAITSRRARCAPPHLCAQLNLSVHVSTVKVQNARPTAPPAPQISHGERPSTQQVGPRHTAVQRKSRASLAPQIIDARTVCA